MATPESDNIHLYRFGHPLLQLIPNEYYRSNNVNKSARLIKRDCILAGAYYRRRFARQLKLIAVLCFGLHLK